MSALGPAHQVRMMTTLAEFEAVLADSAAKPVLLFKHSKTCGLSAMAAEEVAELLDTGPLDAEIRVVDVRASRDLSRTIAERLRIRHESPQVLLIHDGTVVWHRSHASLTAAAIARALTQLASR